MSTTAPETDLGLTNDLPDTPGLLSRMGAEVFATFVLVLLAGAVLIYRRTLPKRREEHKIIIVFSDGLPNDMVSGRKREGAPEVYVGDAAIRDTCDLLSEVMPKLCTSLSMRRVETPSR